MMDAKAFDQWYGSYEATVKKSDANNEYPFAGYFKLMDLCVNKINKFQNLHVLDIGIGTGYLAKQLYPFHTITGIDFSDNMLAHCKETMPLATLIKHDMGLGFPNLNQKFDVIVATYSLHHLKDI